MASVGVRCASDRFLNSIFRASSSRGNQDEAFSSSSSSLSFSSNIDGPYSILKRGSLVMSVQAARISSPVCSLSVPYPANSSFSSSSSSPLSSFSSTLLSGGGSDEKEKKSSESAVGFENIDSWVRDSVGEIVRNLREAPLLVHIYKTGSSGSTTLKTEKAVEEEWPVVMNRWEKREAPMPEGLIFVDELDEEEGKQSGRDLYNSKRADEEDGGGVTKSWGIVVQGRGAGGGGVDCGGPVCYLLKTSKVGCAGVGLCSTHFALKKVSSLRETTRSQFKNFWLVGSPHN